jgi:hypothetical protein
MTTENNKIIAEFMEVKIVEEVYYILSQFTYCNLETDFCTRDQYNAKDLKYDSDWNWLMEVVEKIESLEFYVRTDYNDVYVINDDSDIIIDNPMQEGKPNKKSLVYAVCVEFIKWYNEQKKV